MNARTFHSIMLPVPIVFGLVFFGVLLPENSPWAMAHAMLWVLLMAYGVFGAALGLLYCFGRFRLGCPVCDRSSRVCGPTRHRKQSLVLECPACGDLVVSSRYFFGFRCERLDELEAAYDARQPARQEEAARYRRVALLAALQDRPSLIFRSYALNLILYPALYLAGARWHVIGFSAIASLGCLGALYAALRRKEIWGNGVRATPTDAAGSYWRGMLFGYGIYLAFTFFSIPLHLQDVARGKVRSALPPPVESR